MVRQCQGEPSEGGLQRPQSPDNRAVQGASRADPQRGQTVQEICRKPQSQVRLGGCPRATDSPGWIERC